MKEKRERFEELLNENLWHPNRDLKQATVIMVMKAYDETAEEFDKEQRKIDRTTVENIHAIRQVDKLACDISS